LPSPELIDVVVVGVERGQPIRQSWCLDALVRGKK